MSKQFSLMIFANMLLSLLFIAFNFMYSSLATGDHRAVWSPIWIIFYNIRAFGDVGAAYPNFTFYFFWISTIINVYFIFRVQRVIDKQNTS